MSLNITAAARNATREELLTFLQEKIDTSKQHLLRESQGRNISKALDESRESNKQPRAILNEEKLEKLTRNISKALDESKELSKQPYAVVNEEKLEELNQVNRQISEEIPTAFPNVVTLEWIQSYCQDRSTLLIESMRTQRIQLHKTLCVVVTIFVVCLVCSLSGMVLFFLLLQILSLVFVLLGSLCAIAGIVWLQKAYRQKALIHRAVEKQDLLNKLKTTQFLIEQITDEKSKNATLRSWFESILVLNIRTDDEVRPSRRKPPRTSLRSVPGPRKKSVTHKETRHALFKDSPGHLKDFSPYL